MAAPSTAANDQAKDPLPGQLREPGALRRSWWAFAISGVAGIAFGLLAAANPQIGLLVLALFFAATLLVEGVVQLWAAWRHRRLRGAGWLAFLGGMGAAVGLFALAVPPAAVLGFVAVVAFHAVLLGAILVGIGYRIRRQVEGEWVLYLTGALSLLFGVLVLLQPAAGGLSIVLMVAVWSTITGALQLVLAWRLARSERGA